jgi:hypothetical protein
MKVQTFNNHLALERVSNAMQQVTEGEIGIGMEKVALLLRVSCVHSLDTLRPSVIV